MNVTPTKISLQRVVSLEPYHTETFMIEATLPENSMRLEILKGFEELREQLNTQVREAYRNWDDKNSGAW